jgi:hypothetical protein
MGRDGELIPAAHADWFARGFGVYNRRLIGKSFHALRVDPALPGLFARLDAEPRPVIIAMNHASWWDPLVMLALAGKLLQSRRGIAPIDAEQLRRFAFFRKLGLFGIDPDDPASLGAMLEYAASWFAANARPTLVLTTQGRFTDVREPIVNRPGAAAVASRLGAGNVVVACVLIEYAFWQDQRPEVFVRGALVPDPPAATHSTASWHRSIQATMRATAEALASGVISRDPAAFVPLIGAGAARINPVYDLWLRLRGRSGQIEARRKDPGSGGVRAMGGPTPQTSAGGEP